MIEKKICAMRREGAEGVNRGKGILEKDKSWKKITEVWEGIFGELHKFDETGEGVGVLGVDGIRETGRCNQIMNVCAPCSEVCKEF